MLYKYNSSSEMDRFYIRIRKNIYIYIKLREFCPAFLFFFKLGKDYHYPVSVAGHLGLVEHHCSMGA
jgi:hypothetical protein